MSSTLSTVRLVQCTPKISISLEPKYQISVQNTNLNLSFLLRRPINFQKIRTRLSYTRPITFQRIKIRTRLSSEPLEEAIKLEDLPLNLQEIVEVFQRAHDPLSKYKQLIFLGSWYLRPLAAQFKTSENKVQGCCLSQFWVRAYLDSKRNVVYQADSDSQLGKGLAALLVLGLSGLPVDEVLRVSPECLLLLGLHQFLTPSMYNGFLNLLKLMQTKALQLSSV